MSMFIRRWPSVVAAAALALSATPAWADQDDSSIEAIGKTADELGREITKLQTRYVNPALVENRHEVETRINDGRVFYLLKDYGRASIIFLDLVSNKTQVGTPAHRDSLFYLADSLFLKGNYIGARRHFEELIKTGAADYYADSVKRLIEIATFSGDYDNVEHLYQQAQSRGHTSHELAYVYGKGLFFQDKLDASFQVFRSVPADSPVYLASVYFQATILAKKGADAKDKAMLDQSAALFERVLELGAAQKDDEAAAEMVELAHLSRGRLYYESGEYDNAINEYQFVSRTSSHFDRAMYELTWTFIKKDELRAAQRQLDYLLLGDADSALVPEARLIRADLLLRLGEYADAVATYQQVVDDYEPIQSHLEELMRADDGARAYFDALVGRDVGVLDRLRLPAVVESWVQDDPKMGRTLGVARDLEVSRQDIAESVSIIEDLEDVVNSRSKVDIFPELKEGWGRGLEVQARFIALKENLTTLEAKVLVGPAGGSAEYQQAHERRVRLEKDYREVPKSRAEMVKREESVKDRYNQLEIRVFKLGYEIDSMKAQLVAMDKWIEDVGGSGQQDMKVGDEQAIRAGMEQQQILVDELEKERLELRRIVRRGRTQTGINDLVAAREDDLRQRYQEAMTEERTALAALTGTAPPNAARKVEQIDAVFAQVARHEVALQTYFTKLEVIVNTKVAEIRSEIDVEKAKISSYSTDLQSFSGTSESLAGDIAVSNFRRVEERFDDLILKADVGIIDVAWKRKEARSGRIKELFELKSNDLKSLDQVFEGVRSGD